MDKAHNDSSYTGPSVSTSGAEDGPAMLADPTQPGVASVTLGNSVGCEQPEGAGNSTQIESPSEEMSDQISIAAGILMHGRKPLLVGLPEVRAYAFASHERWISDEAVESWVLPAEYLWKIDFPVKG
jgi:hypothetical protein